MQTSRITCDPGELRALGQAISQTRREQGLSHRELAQRVGVAHKRLQVIEDGLQDPGYKLLRRIADTLGRTPQALMLHAEELHANQAGVGAWGGFAQLRALGRTIHEQRTQQGLDTGELAATLGISHTCLTDLEEGRYDPRLDLLWDLADALHLPPEELARRATQP